MKATYSAAVLLLLSGFTLAIAQQAAPTDQVDPVPKLMKNLQSDDVKVAAAAARSLGVIFAPGGKGRPDDAAPVIAALIEKLESRQGGILRREAATALGNIRAKEALEGMKEALNDEDVHVSIAAANAVAKILPVDDARKFLKGRAADATETVLVGVYDGMAEIAKPEDAEFLIAGLTADNWRIQANAVRGLEKAVRAGAKIEPETYDKVAIVLGNEITNAAHAASDFLAHIHNDECLRAAIKAADTRGVGGKDDPTWRLRTYALRTIRRMGWPTYQPAMPVVLRNLGDPIANVSNEARNILYYLLNEHYLSRDDLFPMLLEQLETAEPLYMRAGIMREMGNDVPKQFASRVAKVSAATLEDAMQQEKAWTARAYSAKLLGAAGYTGSMEALAQCVSDNVPNVRNEAGKALERLAPLCKPEQKALVTPVLLPLAQKPVDWRKTAVAARALGHYPSAEVVQPLVKLLSHSVINVKDAAADALSEIARDGDEELAGSIQKPLHAEVTASPQAWEYGAVVLGALQDQAGVPLLVTILKQGNWRAQANAAAAAAEIASADNQLKNQELTDALIKAAQSDVLQVQDAANKALRELKRGT